MLLWPAAAATQYVRMARRDEADASALSTIGNHAELTGALRFFMRAMSGSAGGTMTYK
jgi:hypothetical protein